MNTARKAAALFLVCLTLMTPLSAYAASGAALKASAFESVNTVTGLTLTTDQKSYSPYSLALTLRFQNKTRRDYDYGAEYYLEKYVDGQWYTLVRDVYYPAIGYVLAAKSSLKEVLAITDPTGFYSFYGQIEPGIYRVVKRMRDAQTNETVYLAAEFLVEDTFLYAKEPVNLRTGPSTGYAVIRELDLGERVSYIRKSGKWTLVRAGEQTGYAYGKYLTKNETDCYYNLFAVKLLRKAGVKDARVDGVRAVTPNDGFTERGGIPYGCDRLVWVEWTKPYFLGGLSIFVYADAASAQKKFAELASSNTILPDVDFSYFLQGRYILRLLTGGIAEVDPNRREQAFLDRIEYALWQACEDRIGYNRTLGQK